MSDWPRCMSPQANTPGTLVIQLASRHTLPRSVSLTPRSVSMPRRSRQQLELVDRGGALTVHRAQTVGARVAAADDDDALAGRADEPLVGNLIALAPLVLEHQVLHREVDAGELASGDREIARPAGPTGQDERIEVAAERLDRHVHADVRARLETHAALLHELEPAVDEALLHLELGNAVAQEAADPVVTLEDGHEMAGAVELLGGGESGRARADDRD